MPSFKIINNPNEINLSREWTPALKFNCKGRIVDEKGHKVSSDFKGRTYQILEKKQRNFTCAERFGRGLLGTAIVICTLFLALFSKSVRNLFTKPKENIRFGILTSALGKFSEAELQQGVSISDETISKIQTCMTSILNREETDEVTLYNSQHKHRVFSLSSAPDLIFKMDTSREEPTKRRYEKMITAQTVLRTHQLGLLVIPHAKLFTVTVNGKEHHIIAERKLDINPHESMQEKYYAEYEQSLDEAIRQLAIFITKTGYSDVEWRNNPVLDNSLDADGNRKIALIDLEEMDDPEIGLFGGGFGRRGLVRCVSERQGEIVRKVAEENGIKTTSFKGASERRKQEIADRDSLKEFYQTKGITEGNEPVEIDVETIDFSKYPEKITRLRENATMLVNAINISITEASPEESLKQRRYIYINTNTRQFSTLLKTIDEKVDYSRYNDDDYYNATYIGHIVNKLIELKVIHRLVNRNGHGYFLQA